ncbi:unnamed protein product, partial [Closterium sp. Yama58-4]
SLTDLGHEAGGSGRQAAMVAAEAAATGGQRMVRMWERLKRIMPPPRGSDLE